MKKSKSPIKFGIGISIVLILSFLLFASLNLHINPIYSLINGLIMATGMLAFINNYKKEKQETFNYQKGFVATLFTGFNATVTFTLFFAIYADIIEPNYISTLLGNWSKHTPETLVVFTVFSMGLVTTLLLSLTYMQYYKNSWNLLKPSNTLSIKPL